ncbi:hypothetical protein MPER_12182 [Moniliophthora perniciosa FA553]|nr:hypothetical protein MPER_12182 [Moniliophthora perniciosa FA553]
MQSRLSISLLSALLLLFTQLATALPSPAAREVEARAADVESRGWNYGDKELGYGNNRWGHDDDDHKWDHHDDELDHYHEHSAWDVLLQVQVDISVEIDAISESFSRSKLILNSDLIQMSSRELPGTHLRRLLYTRHHN